MNVLADLAWKKKTEFSESKGGTRNLSPCPKMELNIRLSSREKYAIKIKARQQRTEAAISRLSGAH